MRHILELTTYKLNDTADIKPEIHITMVDQNPKFRDIIACSDGVRWEVAVVDNGMVYAHRIPEQATHRTNRPNNTGVYFYIDNGEVYRWSLTWPCWNYVGRGIGYIEAL